jgi:RNA polymerase sigma-70 factor, ECF subfamily
MQNAEGSSSRLEVPPELVKRAATEGDAFGEIYDVYLPRVFAFCRMRTSSREEAEDLTAVTFERALAHIGQYEDRGRPFSSWLLRIAANAATDHARRTRAYSTMDGSMEPADDAYLDRWERAFWLRSHLMQLPHDQQEVVRLRFFEDRTFSDVASKMNRSEGAVKQLLRRAVQGLHLRLSEERSIDV